MSRWQPNARDRLKQAALELFVEVGFAEATVPQITARAGLTTRTFFRHFADKREVLFGGDGLASAIGAAIEAAAPGIPALEAVAHAFDRLGAEVFTRDRRELTRRRRAVIAASPELREREALKGLSIVAAMTEALRRRGEPEASASVAAELAALVLKLAYERWSEAANQDDFDEVARQALADVRAVSAAR